MSDVTNWQALRTEHGSDKARAMIVSRLRELAVLVEANKMPGVFDWTDDRSANPFVRIELVLSYPWGG